MYTRRHWIPSQKVIMHVDAGKWTLSHLSNPYVNFSPWSWKSRISRVLVQKGIHRWASLEVQLGEETLPTKMSTVLPSVNLWSLSASTLVSTSKLSIFISIKCGCQKILLSWKHHIRVSGTLKSMFKRCYLWRNVVIYFLLSNWLLFNLYHSRHSLYFMSRPPEINALRSNIQLLRRSEGAFIWHITSTVSGSTAQIHYLRTSSSPITLITYLYWSWFGFVSSVGLFPGSSTVLLYVLHWTECHSAQYL